MIRKGDCSSSHDGDGPDEPGPQRLLDDNEEPLVARAVEQDVDRGVGGEQEVGHEGAHFHPMGPLVHDLLVDQRPHQLQAKVRAGSL